MDDETRDIREQCEAQLRDFARLGAMRPTDDAEADEITYGDAVEEAEAGILSVGLRWTVAVVLCTGGPHVEVVSEDGGPWIVQGWGWFGAGRWSRELSDEEVSGLEACIGGDFDEVVGYLSEREA